MNKNSSLKKTPIAVIGMSAMFADARNIEDFWENIILSKDSITDVPDNRWAIDDYYDADPAAPDKTYCKRGGFLPDIDFNPMEFGLPPNILEVTDASQLLGLVAARDAFEDAGYGKDSEKFTAALKEKTGVLLGVGGGQKLITPLIARLQYPIWERALRASGVDEKDIPHIVEKMKKAYVGWNENAFPGLLGNVISGRITNRFDLGGINSVVDAACAASLSAVKMALSELVEGRCDMMLTGGVDTDNSPFMYMSFSKTPAFSKSGNISPFSDDADGMLIGEGLGMMVLKRLSDAERDGDRIYAVIKGVGTSSDGRFKSVYAPRPAGQALAMNRAYEDAGYPASSVGLIEAHGTGTGAGDPTEFTSMQMVFGADNNKKQHIALGSVKSQIGHTKAAAGAAGLVKAALSLHHKVLPPTLNVEKPNSKFDISNSAIYINTEPRPWFRNGHPRRAGVSAFGFGGINVHITLEEYEGKQSTNFRLHQPYKSMLLHAGSPALLIGKCESVLNELQADQGEATFLNLLKESENRTPAASDARIGFVAKNKQEAIGYLQTSIKAMQNDSNAWEHPKGIYYRPGGVDIAKQKIVALFAGQGSQYTGMGKELANAFPEVASTFVEMDALFLESKEEPLSQSIFPRPSFTEEERKANQDRLTSTQFAQPAIGAYSMGQYRILQKSGFRPDFTAGHSFGELTALWAAGVLDDKTFLTLAKTRGAAMATTSPDKDPGTMLAVKASSKVVEKEISGIKSVRIANINSLNQVVLGGSTEGIRKAEEQLKEKGFSVIPLPVSAAFHTELVGHAEAPFSKVIAQQKLNKPQIPVYSNTTGQAYPEDVEALKSTLNQQILNPVLFKDEIEHLHQAGGRIFIEFGPKEILTNLVKDILKDKDHTAIALNPHPKGDSDLQFRQAVIRMRVLGMTLSNIDPYKREMPALPEPTSMNVKLSGYNYVSPPTQQAYQEALNNGFRVSGGQEKVVEKIVEVEKIIKVPAGNGGEHPVENQEEMPNKEMLKLLQTTMDSFAANQNKSLEIFERFLREQNQQSQQLIQLLSGQMNGGQPASTAKVQEPAEQASTKLASIPEPGNETLKQPVVMDEVAPAVIPVAQPVEVKEPARQTEAISNQSMEQALLAVVSEKTGYPIEMLEMNMDMEADLGIDSIKRVEIFGALTQQYPEMGDVNPNELTELRTLAEIVGHVSAGTATAGVQAASAVAASAAAISTPVVAAPAKASPPAGRADSSQMEEALLKVVSEKTGYPAEMLELSMDMEADLGIDSIKRVEIFGALTQDHPEMADINPNELTELRTLEAIIQHVSRNGLSEDMPAAGSKEPVEVAEAQDEINTSQEPGAPDQGLEQALLAVVSEKTGYPVEMLEMNMDLEADLGIDSIKRVEIFGALTQDHPEMADINPNELTELRTLAEIVKHVGAVGVSVPTIIKEAVASPADIPATAEPSTESPAIIQQSGSVDLEKALLEVVSEKTGYPAEMLELNMDMEADLGIDSIKRVEIFGALTQQYPNVSEINPNELTELRTLQEIVDYVGESQKKKSKNSSLATPAFKAEEKEFEQKSVDFHGVTRHEIGLKYLPQPDFLEFTLPDTHCILVTNEGTEFTGQVIENLSSQGHRVVTLNLPGIDNPRSHDAVDVSATTDESVKASLEEVHSKYGKVGSFIHLHPHFEFENGYFTQHFDAERAIVKTLFFLAKHLHADLNELGRIQPARFLTVTRLDGNMGFAKRGNISVVGGGIPGLIKSLNLEWSPVFCRAIDLQPELPVKQMADQVLAEFHDPNAMVVEVGISKEGRKTTQTKLQAVPTDRSQKPTVSENSVFLISGGARGVTAHCVVEMAGAFKCKFILVGRSSSDFEVPEHAKNGIDDGTMKRNIMNELKEQGEKPSLSKVQHIFNEIVAKKEIDDTLNKIRNAGGKAVYLQGDVTNLGSIQDELAKVTQEWGPVTGIIHGAGRLADKYIQDKTEADFENVLSVKLDGLMSLLRVVDFNKLKHLFMFSSVAGFYGNVGQTDYAIANEILSRAAHLFKTNHPDTHVSAINWGAWDSGMVSGELKAQFEAAGVKLVNSDGGAAMLVNEFSVQYRNQPQVVIGDTLPAAVSYMGELKKHTIKRELKQENNPFLQHHVIQGNAVLPVVNAFGWMAQVCENLYPDYRVFKLEDAKLFKGIVFDGSEQKSYTVVAEEIEKTDEKIVFVTTVTSNGATLPVNHYKATITLVHGKSKLEPPFYHHPLDKNSSPTDGKSLYTDGSLFHDEYFQGIEEILEFTPDHILLSCVAPDVAVSEQGQFPIQTINTFFADIQYQGMVVWVQKFMGGAKSLPLKTDNAVIYKRIPAGKRLFVHVSIVEATDYVMQARCLVFDEKGLVYMETNGASVTVSKELVW